MLFGLEQDAIDRYTLRRDPEARLTATTRDILVSDTVLHEPIIILI
jgi:hypothetical protein